MSLLVEKHVHQSEQTQPLKKIIKKQQRISKGKLTKGEKLLFAISSIILTFILILIVTNYATLYSSNDVLQQTEISIVAQENSLEGLELQVKELSNPERILDIAQNELGMTLNDRNIKVIHGNE